MSHISALDDLEEAQEDLPFDVGDAKQVKARLSGQRLSRRCGRITLKGFLSTIEGRDWFFALPGAMWSVPESVHAGPKHNEFQLWGDEYWAEALSEGGRCFARCLSTNAKGE